MRVGILGAATSVALFSTFLYLQSPWAFRLLLGMPSAAATVAWLEATRNTCVFMAARGRHEDARGHSHPVDAVRALASRLMAKTIYRDAFFVGVCASALGVVSATVR
jgi:hypothetical protein